MPSTTQVSFDQFLTSILPVFDQYLTVAQAKHNPSGRTVALKISRPRSDFTAIMEDTPYAYEPLGLRSAYKGVPSMSIAAHPREGARGGEGV